MRIIVELDGRLSMKDVEAHYRENGSVDFKKIREDLLSKGHTVGAIREFR